MIAYERVADGRLVARTTVDVGAETHDVSIDLGPWPETASDPTGPLGLAATPVVVLDDDRWIDLAASGVRRAGRGAPCARVAAEAERLGLRLLLLVAEGADAVLVARGDTATLDVARALGGRPIAAIPLNRSDALGAWLEDCAFDVHIPIPSLDEPARGELRDLLAPLALETAHHVVEVDPQPALAEAGLDPGEVSVGALAVAAAGVLAGRLAAANRRWRTEAGI